MLGKPVFTGSLGRAFMLLSLASLAVCVPRAAVAEAFAIRLNLQPGQAFLHKVNEELITKVITNGQEESTLETRSCVLEYFVEEADAAGNLGIAVQYRSVTVKPHNGEPMHFDPKNQEVWGFYNLPVYFRMSPYGHYVLEDGNIPPTEMIRFFVRPYTDKPVQKGDSWTREEFLNEPVPIKTVGHYRLCQVENGQYEIEFDVLVDYEPFIARFPNETHSTYMNGRITGFLRMDQKSGWITKSESMMDMNTRFDTEKNGKTATGHVKIVYIAIWEPQQ